MSEWFAHQVLFNANDQKFSATCCDERILCGQLGNTDDRMKWNSLTVHSYALRGGVVMISKFMPDLYNKSANVQFTLFLFLFFLEISILWHEVHVRRTREKRRNSHLHNGSVRIIRTLYQNRTREDPEINYIRNNASQGIIVEELLRTISVKVVRRYF